MGPAQVLDQGLTGLVLQLLEGGSADVDRQGFGLGFQVAGAFSQNAEHDLTHAGLSLSFRLHPWPIGELVPVRRDTGNRPCRYLLGRVRLSGFVSGFRESVGTGMSEQQRSPSDAAGHEAAAQPRRTDQMENALREMEGQLRRHSALEHLGPLFAPEAQGRQQDDQPSGEPPPPGGQA